MNRPASASYYSSSYTSLHMEGHGLPRNNKLHVVEPIEDRGLDHVVAGLEADKSALERELHQAYAKLQSALTESSAWQQAFELDKLMAPGEGPIRLSSHMVNEMWQYVSFLVLKKERDRRVFAFAKCDAALDERERAHQTALLQRERDADLLRTELRDLETKYAEALETIDNLRLKQNAVALCEAEKGSVTTSLTEGGDSARRPWVADNATEMAMLEWKFADWLEPLGLHRILAEPFELMLADAAAPKGMSNSEGRKAFVHALGRHGSRDTITAMLRAAPLLDGLSTAIWSAVQELTTQLDGLAKGLEKVRQDATEHGDDDDADRFRNDLFRGLPLGNAQMLNTSLGDAVGHPSVDGLAAMAREHIAREDADVKFVEPNYEITTSSKLEWFIVNDPDKALVELGMEDWPCGGGHTPVELGFRLLRTSDDERFTEKIHEINTKLAAAGDRDKFSLEYLVALRMYTGPCYIKYNAVLRGAYSHLSSDALNEYLRVHCTGNTYPTTMMYTCRGINKLSLLTKPAKVYRAPGGAQHEFFEMPEEGIVGGVEMGFMSTSLDKSQAIKYASSCGSPLIYEVQQTFAARGADVSWLSQFPSEGEVLLSPLTLCEVHRIRTEGAFIVVELRPATSFAARTTQMEVHCDEQLQAMLHMLRMDTLRSVVDRIDDGVKAMGGRPADLFPSLENMRGRAEAHHTTAALMANAYSELAALVAPEVDAAERLATSDKEKQIELKAAAESVRRRAKHAAEGEKRFRAAEAVAAEEKAAIDRLRAYSPGERLSSTKKARSRWATVQAHTLSEKSFASMRSRRLRN